MIPQLHDMTNFGNKRIHAYSVGELRSELHVHQFPELHGLYDTARPTHTHTHTHTHRVLPLFSDIKSIASLGSRAAERICGGSRNMILSVYDKFEREVMSFGRPVSFGCCWCRCGENVLEVQAPIGNVIGLAKQK